MTLTGLTIPFNGLKKQYNNLRNEILNVTDEVLRSGQLIDGNYTVEFENWLSKKNQSRYAVTCHSGTQALEIIADHYKNILPRERRNVILPAITYPATANAFLKSGFNYHQVNIFDVDNYGILDTKKFQLFQDNDLVVIVGLYGASVENYIKNINTGIIIEDAAQHWLADNCRRFGVASAISFDPTKNLPNYSNGGAVVTNDLDLVEHARSWRSHGKPNFCSVGTNSRMSEIDCAQLLVKTRYLDLWQHRRHTIAAYWIEIFTKHGIRCLIDINNVKTHGFQKFVIELDYRNIIKDKLESRKIECKIHYEKPLCELPAFFSCGNNTTFLSNAASLSRRVLSLPFYPELTDLEVEYIAEQIVSVYDTSKSRH